MKSETEQMKEELTNLCQLHQLCPNNLPYVVDKASEHFSLLLKWNKKISLTTITQPKIAATQLYFESLFASKFINNKIKSVADVGSGAGFPGIALALAMPNLPMTLIESDGRKAVFLTEAKRNLNLTNINIANERFENLFTSFDLVTVRALEKLENQIPSLLKFAQNSKLLIFFISLQTSEKVLLAYKRELLCYKPEIVPLPESQNRVLLLLYNIDCST
jgi:16S rRNA (guanine527-N7)-methyltransferase